MSTRVILLSALLSLLLAVEYQFYHGLGLLGLGIWSNQVGLTRAIRFAALCLLLGMVLFSGSLYALVLTGINALGMITPFGGVLFMLAWIVWAGAVLTLQDADAPRN